MNAMMEYKGKDVEEAIANACQALGVAREALEVQVVSAGFGGIFGLGRKKAVIRVNIRQGVSSNAPPAAPEQEAAASPAPAPPDSSRQAGPDEEGGRPGVAILSAAELDTVRTTVDRLLTLTGSAVTANIEQNPTDGKLLLNLEGEESARLVGSEGQVLDALQYLLRKMLTKQLQQRLNLEIDADGYRHRRREELEQRARELAVEVKSSGKSRSMPAIGPAERRFVHMALQQDKEVRSRSIGEGVFKKVLIQPPGKGRKRSPRPRRQ
ncbi:MAG: RNA-binding cell elongation regulator Jag/EloR [Desulfurivibrio sp.]|nr:RNA-binding cell elongation regulator Jag/EloR [Desulfurivibrio sp.]